MNTPVLYTQPEQPDPTVLQEAGRILRLGGLVVIPTETVYGLAADAFSPGAVTRLRSAKGRPDTKPLPVMLGDAEEMRDFAHRIPEEAWLLAEAFWPGPLTMVLYAGDRVGEAIHAGTERVGLRVPDHAVAQGVLKAARRPLVLTSANLSGEPDTTKAAQALAALDGRVDLIVDAGTTALGQPSTVLDLTAVPPRILREGRIGAARLRELIELDTGA